MQIFYYTRTGRSRAVAQQLAERCGTQALEIRDGVDFGGVLGFIKAGAKAAKKERLPITHPQIEETGEVLLVFPIWAGGFPPAVNSFLALLPRERISLVATSLKSRLKDREGFARIFDLIGKEIDAADVEL